MENVARIENGKRPPRDIRRVYDLQKANRWAMSQTCAKERIEKLKRLQTALWDRRGDIHRAVFEDFAKNPGETDLTEFFPLISEINHTIKHLSAWMKPSRQKTPTALFGTSSKIRYEAKGLVLILSPWNYPINLSLVPLVAAISAGNCVLLKPSSKVPQTAELLGALIGDVFDESEAAVFTGSSKVSNELLKLKFDHIFFTGSPRIGQTVMRAAAEHLTSVTLELGGKSPVIVDETANIEKAAARIMWGKFINAGQTCVAPDYLFVHEDRHDEFVEASVRVLEQRYGKTPQARKDSDSYCRLVTQKQQEWLTNTVDACVEQGASVAFGGEGHTEERYLEPTLLDNVTTDAPIMQDEIFGPILPIIKFKDLEEPIRYIREHEKPLALYIFSKNGTSVERVLHNTSSGGACVNSTVIHLANPNLPFGGIGQSGMGSYHGIHGFRTLSHERAVLHQKTPDTLQLFYPPYTERVRKTILKAIRYLG